MALKCLGTLPERHTRGLGYLGSSRIGKCLCEAPEGFDGVLAVLHGMNV